MGDGIDARRSGLLGVRILHLSVSTLSYCVISTLVSFEECAQFLHAGVAVFLRDYGLLVEDDCFVPLNDRTFTSVCFSS